MTGSSREVDHCNRCERDICSRSRQIWSFRQIKAIQKSVEEGGIDGPVTAGRQDGTIGPSGPALLHGP